MVAITKLTQWQENGHGCGNSGGMYGVDTKWCWYELIEIIHLGQMESNKKVAGGNFYAHLAHPIWLKR